MPRPMRPGIGLAPVSTSLNSDRPDHWWSGRLDVLVGPSTLVSDLLSSGALVGTDIYRGKWSCKSTLSPLIVPTHTGKRLWLNTKNEIPGEILENTATYSIIHGRNHHDLHNKTSSRDQKFHSWTLVLLSSLQFILGLPVVASTLFVNCSFFFSFSFWTLFLNSL